MLQLRMFGHIFEVELECSLEKILKGRNPEKQNIR